MNKKWKKERVGITLANQVKELARENGVYRWKVYDAIGKQLERKRKYKSKLRDWEFKI